jgi:hypothetical protein
VPHYTSVFRDASLSDVLEEMKLVLPLNYAISTDRVTITIINN